MGTYNIGNRNESIKKPQKDIKVLNIRKKKIDTSQSFKVAKTENLN